METIASITNAANKAIWGTNEANQEPVSGVKGNTNQGEPYDAGNIEDPAVKEKKANIADANATSGTTGSALASEPTTTTGLATTSIPSTNTASTEPTGSSATDDSPRHKSNPSTTEKTLPDRSRDAEATMPQGSSEHEDIGKPELNKTSPGDVPPADSAAGKTDTREPADPATDPAPKGQDVSNKASGPIDGGDKLDGPGPRPLEVVAKERGGDAGNIKGSAKGGLAKDDSTSGIDDKNEKDPKEVSHGEGTGEKYIKTSGLAVDGGDFDATKPGAGREADRLLDEKDPAHAAAKAAVKSGSSDKTSDKMSDKTGGARDHTPDSGTEKEKESLKDKIKAKLHRH
ncbi:hypothetical protein LX36DRAFT_281620 [Colletotrichum falcatum]|nr:hypothetical protein LX36DRAFT_281620 [Colletotrichum falcatum]